MAALYQRLAVQQPSPVIELNRAVAVSRAQERGASLTANAREQAVLRARAQAVPIA